MVAEQAGVDGIVGENICAFNEIPGAGYFRPGTMRIFLDKVVKVVRRDIRLDGRAERYVWVPPDVALRELDIEPNARKTIEAYCQRPC